MLKFKKDMDPVDFINTARKCSRDLFYETEEGDRLNLKSTLSGYIFAASAVNRTFLDKGTVVCENEEDYQEIRNYVEQPSA